MQNNNETVVKLQTFIDVRNAYESAKRYENDVSETLEAILGSISNADVEKLEKSENEPIEHFEETYRSAIAKMCDKATLAHIGLTVDESELSLQAAWTNERNRLINAPSEKARIESEIAAVNEASAKTSSAFKLGKDRSTGFVRLLKLLAFVLLIAGSVLEVLLALGSAANGYPAMLLSSLIWPIGFLAIYCFVRVNRGKAIVEKTKQAQAARKADLEAQLSECRRIAENADATMKNYYACVSLARPRLINACSTLRQMLDSAQSKKLALQHERDLAAHAADLHPEYYESADTLKEYLEKARARDLQEAINLYHDEMRKLKDSEIARQSAERQAKAAEEASRKVAEEAKRQTAAVAAGEAARTASTLAGEFLRTSEVKKGQQRQARAAEEEARAVRDFLNRH